MPLIRTKKITPEEQRIARAITALKNREQPNVTKAHHKYNVPYSKLWARYYSRPYTDSLSGSNKLLDDAQEQALLQYIDRCDKLGCQCTYKLIERGANSVLRQSGSPKTVSKAWTSRFIKRHKVNSSIIYRICNILNNIRLFVIVQSLCLRNVRQLRDVKTLIPTLQNFGASGESF